MLFKQQVDDIKAHGLKLLEFGTNFEAVAIVNSMLIENLNMQMESEIADLLDRRMMSLFGINTTPTNKIDAQNTSNKLQKAQHITTGGKRSINDSMTERRGYGDEHQEKRKRQSVTIGLNANDTYSSIELGDEIPNERSVIANEYRNAREALKATGQLPISIDNNCLMNM